LRVKCPSPPPSVRPPTPLAPSAAAADAHSPRGWVDVDVLQAGQVDHDAVVAGPETGAVVAAAAHREQLVVFAREGDDLRDVVGVGTLGDQCRPAIDHRVVDLARLVVLGVCRPDESSLEARQLASCVLGQCAESGHDSSLPPALRSLVRTYVAGRAPS
jgi:hypothetical protein